MTQSYRNCTTRRPVFDRSLCGLQTLVRLFRFTDQKIQKDPKCYLKQFTMLTFVNLNVENLCKQHRDDWCIRYLLYKFNGQKPLNIAQSKIKL